MKRAAIVMLSCLLLVLPALAIVQRAAADSIPPTPPVIPGAPTASGPLSTARAEPPTPPAIPGAPSATGPVSTARADAPTVPAVTIPAITAPPVTVPTIPPQATATGTAATATATLFPPTRGAPPTVPVTPTGTATSTATPTGTVTATASATPCATPTGTATSTATGTATASATPCATAIAATVSTACTSAMAASGPTTALVPASVQKGEVAAQRTRNTRTYAIGKGKFQQVISTGSLNYQDAQGKWQPIDSTLVAATTPGYAYQNKGNAYTLALPTDLASNPVRVTSGSNTVSFSLVGAKGAGTPCGATQTYANAVPGVNLAYTAGGDGAEETLTLASATAPNTYVFTVQMSAGLTAKANSHGGIDFTDGAGKVQLAFVAPLMYDSATPKRAESTAVTLQLATTPAGTTATLTADAAWLHDGARVYPVVIDPSVTLPTAAQDCQIISGDPNICSGSYTQNLIQGGSAHSLLQFDVSQFNTNFHIDTATVHMLLAQSGPNYFDYMTVKTRRVRQSWVQSQVSWVRRSENPPVDWQVPGGDVTSPITESRVGPGPDAADCDLSDCSFDVKDMTQMWINGTAPNYGMLFEGDTGPQTGLYLRFFSSGHPDVNKHPWLVITYTGLSGDGTIKPDLGSRPFYTIAGSQIDDRTSVGVNVASGNLLVEASDLTLPGIGLGFGITRAYNSRTIYRGAFGDHWSMGTGPDLWLSIFPNGPNSDIVLQGASGYQVGFRWNTTTSSWDKPAGLDATLTYASGLYTLRYHASLATYTFDSTGRMLTQQDRNGNAITFAYDPSAPRQLATVTDTENRTVSFHYNAAGFVDTITDANLSPARVWYYNYEDPNNPTSLTRVVEPVQNRTTTYHYDASTGNLSSIVDPKGNTTSFGYEGGSRTRLTSLTRVSFTTNFTYTAASDLAGQTYMDDATPAHNRTTLTYDANGEITQVLDAAGYHYDYGYNSNRKIITISDAYQHVTTYTYDPNDNERLTDVNLPSSVPNVPGPHTQTVYDANCKYFPSQVKDAQGSVVTYQYDNGTNCNRTQAVSDPGAGHLNYTVTYEYVVNGPHKQLSKVTSAQGNLATPKFFTKIDYTYVNNDPTQWLQTVKVTPPTVTGGTQPGAVTTTFDQAGRAISVLDGKGQLTQSTLDYLNRVTDITFASDPAIHYVFDPNGNLTTRTENAGTTTFGYDALNRPTSKKLPTGPYLADGNSMDYGYDEMGDLTSYTDLGGSVFYHYNNRLLMDTLTEPGGLVTSFAYDQNGQHTTTTYPGSIVQSLIYDNSQRLTNIYAMHGTTVLTNFAYTYLNGTTDTALRQTMGENDPLAFNTTTYTYDAVNRLIGAHTVVTGTSTQKSDYQYGYDANGNRTNTNNGGAATTAAFNEADEQTSWNIGTLRTYTYDANGNETGSSGGEARAYNSRNQTISITGLNGTVSPINYLDGGQGERSSAGGSTYANSSLGVGSETKAGATTYYTRTPGGHLVSQRLAGGAVYYYLFDGLGSVVALADPTTGGVVARYAYDPYGQMVVKQGADGSSATGIADGNPWRYAGAYLDSTGLYKMGARYYDPARGRFTQLDPLGNGYIYASDNPVNFVDPTGLTDGDPAETKGPDARYDDANGAGPLSGYSPEEITSGGITIGRASLNTIPNANGTTLDFRLNVTSLYPDAIVLGGNIIILDSTGAPIVVPLGPNPLPGSVPPSMWQSFQGSVTLPPGEYTVTFSGRIALPDGTIASNPRQTYSFSIPMIR